VLIKSSLAAFVAKVQCAQRFTINLFVEKSHPVSFGLIVDFLIGGVFCEVEVFVVGSECSFEFRSRYASFGRAFVGVRQWVSPVCPESESFIGLSWLVVWKMVSLATLATVGLFLC
jgi:hypothetical protein